MTRFIEIEEWAKPAITALEHEGYYDIGRPIGRSFGRCLVLSAKEYGQQAGEEVALKLFHPDNHFDDGIREFVLHSWVQHPHILPVRGFGAMKDTPYVATELVRGESLLDAHVKMKPLKLPPIEALTIIHQIAEALNALHQQGIVHRDVAMRNILLENRLGEGAINTKLMDFGLSTAINMNGEQLDPGDQFFIEDLKRHWPEGPWHQEPDSKPRLMDLIRSLAGKPAEKSSETRQGLRAVLSDKQENDNPLYFGAAAPEAFDPNRSCDGRADQYALGALAHQLLTGRSPTSGVKGAVDFNGVFKDWLMEQQDLDRSVYLVIKRSVSYHPSDRFDSVLGFSAALSEALGVEPLPTPKPQSGVREASFTAIQQSLQNQRV